VCLPAVWSPLILFELMVSSFFLAEISRTPTYTHPPSHSTYPKNVTWSLGANRSDPSFDDGLSPFSKPSPPPKTLNVWSGPLMHLYLPTLPLVFLDLCQGMTQYAFGKFLCQNGALEHNALRCFFYYPNNIPPRILFTCELLGALG